MFSWFWNLFPSNRAHCLACGNQYAKDAMKELWFRHTEEDGTEGTSSVYVCHPCMADIAEHVENEIIGYDDFEIEVDDD